MGVPASAPDGVALPAGGLAGLHAARSSDSVHNAPNTRSESGARLPPEPTIGIHAPSAFGRIIRACARLPDSLGCPTQANGLVGRCLILMGPLLVLFAGVLVTVLAIVLLALEFAQSELRDVRTRAREELVVSRRSPVAPSAVDLRPLLIQAVAAVGEDVARPIRLDLPDGYLLVV